AAWHYVRVREVKQTVLVNLQWGTRKVMERDLCEIIGLHLPAQIGSDPLDLLVRGDVDAPLPAWVGARFRIGSRHGKLRMGSRQGIPRAPDIGKNFLRRRIGMLHLFAHHDSRKAMQTHLFAATLDV